MQRQESRIQLQDTLLDMFEKMAEGNPGAVRVLVDAYKTAPTVDPDSAMGGLGPLLDLDTLRVYGSDVWLLFKDICNEDMVTLHALLRGWQLGLINSAEIKDSIARARTASGGIQAIDHATLLTKVRERLPRFAPRPITA